MQLPCYVFPWRGGGGDGAGAGAAANSTTTNILGRFWVPFVVSSSSNNINTAAASVLQVQQQPNATTSSCSSAAGNSKPPPAGAERLPPKIVVSETDLHMRRLWGDPRQDTPVRKYLLTMTVGFSERANVNATVHKVAR